MINLNPPSQLEVNKKLTALFIESDPIAIALIPRKGAQTDSGAVTLVDQEPRTTQVMKLIHQAGTLGGKTFTTDGTGRREEFVLLAEYDAEIGLNDYWYDEATEQYWEVVGFKPFNGYEKRAIVNAYALELNYGG